MQTDSLALNYYGSDRMRWTERDQDTADDLAPPSQSGCLVDVLTVQRSCRRP
jgi:hypothetical protein